MKQKEWIAGGLLWLLVIGCAILLIAKSSVAVPAGATLAYQYNSTSAGTEAGNRTDSGGYIYTANVNTRQQNNNWKAYLGNVTGAYTLDDANNATIYNWELSVTGGEVYASRSSTITWTTLGCASPANFTTENSYFGYGTTSADNVNNTFNSTAHKAFRVGTTQILASSCSATYTFVNDSRPATDAASLFQEVLLNDNTSMLYSAIMENNKHGYNGVTYDFQMIIPENGTLTNPNTYYFWTEVE
jgi:hypothetical protein